MALAVIVFFAVSFTRAQSSPEDLARIWSGISPSGEVVSNVFEADGTMAILKNAEPQPASSESLAGALRINIAGDPDLSFPMSYLSESIKREPIPSRHRSSCLKMQRPRCR